MFRKAILIGALLLPAVLLGIGCGGSMGSFQGRSSAPTASCLSGFINQTGLPTSALLAQWTRAQNSIAVNGVYLDAAIHNPPTHLVVDARAMNTQPNCITVISVPDIPVAQLPPAYAQAGYTDPSGVIQCSGLYVHSCVYIGSKTVYTASSIEGTAPEYEFENLILAALGYDLSGR
jgi:hypothetical protein